MGKAEQQLAEKLELFACIQCGKCSGGCPVSVKSPLNIRRLVREVMLARDQQASGRAKLWDCTTCSTCTIRCPRGLEPHELIIALRSALMEQGQVPDTVRDALEGVFKYGNPYNKSREDRSKWANGLAIKDISQGHKTDYLYFVCCATSYDSRLQKVAKTLANVLTKAGVDFGTLGNEETCCGSEVRRMGEVGLFEMLVEDNLKLFSKHGISRIVTTSPHCFDVFKNKYKDSHIEVMHYSQLIARLISQGKISFNKSVKKVVTYHDPCYLGKQNSVFDEPRSVIKAIPGVTFVDMDRSRERSLCCEGGGGRMWVEASAAGQRLSEIRVKNAVEIGAEVLATACPFCLLTLEDAVKAAGLEDKIAVQDIMELVTQAI